MSYDPTRPLRPQLTDANNKALSRPLSLWRRLVAWLHARVTGREATAGGYWGGVTMWDVVKAAATRAKATAATLFLKR